MQDGTTKVVVHTTSRGGARSRRRILASTQGTGLAGALALSLGSPIAPCYLLTSPRFAPSSPARDPSRPRGSCSEVPSKAISRQNFEELAMAAAVDPIVFYLIIFVLAIFVGYHVVWSVTPALHTPLMSVTNAISAIILVGAMLAAGPAAFDWGGWVGMAAVVMASINAFGGFLVTQRMLEMFKRKEPKAVPAEKK